MIESVKNILSSFVPMKLITNNCNPILLYHSLGNYSKFAENIDHVGLEILETQLKNIQKYWKFVSIDEYVNAKNKKGLASLTIDDGYKNVIDDALKVFENLDTPFTIFINSSTIDGKIFWRDKVRYLIENDLVQKFINSSALFTKNHSKRFYFITKDPKFNSIQVEKDIDKFLLKENLEINLSHKICFDNKEYFIEHPLVSYGNHTASHYVLSSLSPQEQYHEIIECKKFINRLNINKSNVFSMPFGGNQSFNSDTLSILNDLNYEYILKSTNNLNTPTLSNQINRFMPKTGKLEQTMKKLYLKKIIKR